MNKIAIGLFFITVIMSPSLFASGDFNGEWSGTSGNKDDSSYSTLNLNLKQVGKDLSGRYCYITRGGGRIDCPDDNEINLHGTTGDNKASITFDSSFGGKNGKAELILNDGKIIWHLIDKPKHGEFYAPTNYSLTPVDIKKSALVKGNVFSTPSFTVTLVNNCGDFYASCQKVNYYGMKNKDNSQISLSGHTIDNPSTGKAEGMIFKNKNVMYVVSFEPLKLKVSQGDKILVEQDGKWE